MFKLKTSLNYGGTIIEAGRPIGFLPAEMQKKLIDNGVAEEVKAEVQSGEKKEKSPDDMTKAELLEYAALLNIDGISDKSTKAEILEAIEAAMKPEE